MEKIFAQVVPSLAAVREKTLQSFQMKQTFVPNKNIGTQRKFFFYKKEESKEIYQKYFNSHFSWFKPECS